MSIFRRRQNSDPVDIPEPEPTQADIEGAWGLSPTTEGSIRMVGSNATPLAIAESELEEATPEETPLEDTAEEKSPKPPLLERISLKERTQNAIRECEIAPSREVMDALTGYYKDHYELANMIGIALGDDFNEEALRLILEREDGVVEKGYFEEFLRGYQSPGFHAPPSAESGVRLLAYAKLKELTATTEQEKQQARDTLLRCASASISWTLFQESSLGITTLKDEELQIIDDLLEKLLSATEGSTGITAHPSSDELIRWPTSIGDKVEIGVLKSKFIKNRILQKKEHFWEDCRMAGQLEIHNTGYLPLIARRGNKLLPRTEQHRRYGTMHTQSAVGERMHSVVPHFSERLDPGGGYKLGKSSSAYATAVESGDSGGGTILIPLAEIIRVAPYARDAHYGIVEQRDPRRPLVKPPNPQDIHDIGSGEYDFVGSGGKDRAFFASSKLEEGPDSYAIELGPTSTILFIGDDIEKSTGYGSGYGFPVIKRAETAGKASREVHEAQQRALEQPIYKGKIVVPLRRGVFDFIPELMPSSMNTAGRKGALYNMNPLLGKVG